MPKKNCLVDSLQLARENRPDISTEDVNSTAVKKCIIIKTEQHLATLDRLESQLASAISNQTIMFCDLLLLSTDL